MPTSRFASVTHTGDGTTVDFVVSFTFLDRAHVKIYLDTVETTAFTWIDDANIQFTAAPALDVVILIQRETPISSRLVDYDDGYKLTEADLDDDSEQAFNLIQESSILPKTIKILIIISEKKYSPMAVTTTKIINGNKLINTVDKLI